MGDNKGSDVILDLAKYSVLHHSINSRDQLPVYSIPCMVSWLQMGLLARYMGDDGCTGELATSATPLGEDMLQRGMLVLIQGVIIITNDDINDHWEDI